MKLQKNVASKALVILACTMPSTAMQAQDLSTYGTTGLIDMPSAATLDDGALAFTSSFAGPTIRNTLTFQITPKLQGTFRYGVIDQYRQRLNENLYDRSFDLSYRINDETQYLPAFAIGLRDFGGTGIYSSEYIVATKSITPAIQVTAGLGWGRLGERNGRPSPFTGISEDFGTRPNTSAGGIGETGQLDFDAWFKGDIAPFGGVSWQVTEKLTLMAEYSSDEYSREVSRGLLSMESPINYGLTYAFDNGVNLGASYLYGSELGVRISYVLDPKTSQAPSGIEESPLALQPRSTVASASWNQPNGAHSVEDVLNARLADQGLMLEGISVNGNRASVRIINTRFPAKAQALGRAARIMANTFAPEVALFDVTFMVNGMATTTASLARADLEELEFDLDGAWKSLARTALSDAKPAGPSDKLTGIYPKFTYALRPYLTPSFFDPDRPVRAEIGASLTAAYETRPGMIISGELRRPFYDTISDAVRVSDSVLPRVRTDGVRYAQESDIELTHLTAEYFFRPGENMYGRLTAGYLESMFGGVSAEVLWQPVNSRLALGAEVNYVKQRDFDMRLGFQDYEVATGFFSAYYDFDNGFQGQLDVGRYLAGDWGGTVTVNRAFKNGVKVGAFFTLTDVSFEDFGEGSFDKGITIEIPIGYLSGDPSLNTFGQTIRTVQRDGGARLDIRNRLYDVTRGYRTPSMEDQWGKFWR